MLRLSLCDYDDAQTLVKGTLKIEPTRAAVSNSANNQVIFKNCAPFANCITRIKNTKVDHAHHTDVVMPMYNLIEYSDNYSKRHGILWQYCRHEPSINSTNGDILYFNVANAAPNTFKIKGEIAFETGDDGTKILK